jgi:signal-transduction protein with cAMP-binding, CBS, and nucleotidyltransferase domain
VVTVHPAAQAHTVLRIMLEEAIEHVPVVEDGALVGISTRADLLKVRRRQLEHERPKAGLAARVSNHGTIQRLRPRLSLSVRSKARTSQDREDLPT